MSVRPVLLIAAAKLLIRIAAPARRIMSLTDPSKKMSKSDPNPNSRILIIDDEETIYQKFKTALTDSHEGISYDPQNRPGVSNLLDILQHTLDEKTSMQDLVADFKDSSLRSLKQAVADAVAKDLKDVREKFLQLHSSLGSPGHDIYNDMRQNQRRVGARAAETMLAVKGAMGLLALNRESQNRLTSIKAS